ncbi:hypothetical protein [Rufibacter roseus]|uniref:Uncharacterized protein n=1 Tax=Rufibacter roseus TaxID=1567108 RepID=A0ABW2DEK1_9BACT|nr:hypothetical protein [Rufibacter roseus]
MRKHIPFILISALLLSFSPVLDAQGTGVTTVTEQQGPIFGKKKNKMKKAKPKRSKANKSKSSKKVKLRKGKPVNRG